MIPPVWIKDSAQTTCSGCNQSFSTFKRRHHCRTCGKLFCHTCCSMFIPVQFNDFQKNVRVCNECYSPLKLQFERHLSLGPFASSPTGPNIITQIVEPVSSSKILKEIEVKEQENMKNDLIDLNEHCRPAYEKNSRKAVRYSSSSRSNKTESIHENDSFSSCTDEELVKIVKETEIIVDRQNLDYSPKPPLPPKPRQTISTNSKIFNKREPICQEYGFWKKIQIKKDLENQLENEASHLNIEKWERVYFVLYSDRTIGICSSPSDVCEPRLVIPLNHYCLKNLGENSFGLDKILIDMTNGSDLNQSIRLNAKRNFFEFNYEIMFQNKDIK